MLAAHLCASSQSTLTPAPHVGPRGQSHRSNARAIHWCRAGPIGQSSCCPRALFSDHTSSLWTHLSSTPTSCNADWWPTSVSTAPSCHDRGRGPTLSPGNSELFNHLAPAVPPSTRYKAPAVPKPQPEVWWVGFGLPCSSRHVVQLDFGISGLLRRFGKRRPWHAAVEPARPLVLSVRVDLCSIVEFLMDGRIGS
jgi:hypothetical protein